MPAAKMRAMSDKDMAAGKAAAMEAAETAAAETATMEAAVKAAAAMKSTTAMAATMAAADFDQSIGDIFRQQRHRARTAQRQRFCALRRRQRQDRRHASRDDDQAPEICAEPCNEI